MSKTTDFLELRLKIEKYKNCFTDGIGTVTINPDLSIDVKGSVSFDNMSPGYHFKQLPFKFRNISDHLTIHGIDELESLEGCPVSLNGLYISECPNLKIDFFPKHISSLSIEKALLTDANVQVIGENVENYKDIKIIGFRWSDCHYSYTEYEYRLIKDCICGFFELELNEIF